MKRVLITGITGNLGHAVQGEFWPEGWGVLGVSRSGNAGVDLKDWQQVDEFIQAAGEFDLVFMAHGVVDTARLGETDSEMWANVVGNNLESAWILTDALKRHRRMKEGGLIVYCSSIQATQPRAGRGLYCVAKAGLEGLTRAAAVEFAADGVRTVCLRLGQMERLMGGMEFGEEERKAVEALIPLPWVPFDEAARLGLALYEQRSLTGEVIEVSSGHRFSVWPK